MDHGKDDAFQQAASALIAELRHWREVSGVSQKALAKLVGYTPSYVSKVENDSLTPSREFIESADEHLRAGGALLRRWKALRDSGPQSRSDRHQQPAAVGDPQSAPSNALTVAREQAELTFRDGLFKTRIRRHLHNVGSDPVTQYLIRIAVDRFPGDPERSNRLYREFPLTWEEIGLSATCGDEPMSWRIKHDRDAFKEVWLLFENGDGRFPLYPGQSASIEYVYTVSKDKWGAWWTRAIRLPTNLLNMTLDFPSEMHPIVWGIETSMTAEASPVKTPIKRTESGDRTIFAWSADSPPLHARYRIEWKFKNSGASEVAEMKTLTPSAQMQTLGIAQEGEPILSEVARPFDLPTEAEDARRVVSQLVATMERVSQVHTFAKGMGIAAPQIGIGRAVAVVRLPGGEIITLINPRIIDESADHDEQYEGCLSFFDVRGMVPRPTSIEVEHQDISGKTQITAFHQPVARLITHEIDHLFGTLYRVRMKPGVEPIPVSQYTGTGQPWTQHRE
ncbi:peptide deformylase [Streptosporangium sp. NPDC006007]|uniref:peptide deformylase n=1 Tax=Streptosporangium sp. NPDC006007 TaxID=3154575 RepID=UPI0033B73E9B